MTETVLTIQKLEDMLGAHKDGVYRFEARGEDFAVDLAVDLLAAMRREGILRKALEDIKTHQQYIGGGLAEFGSTWYIASNALNSCEYSGVEIKDGN